MTDPFLILGVPFDAEDAAIEAAYLAGLRRASPERDPAGFEALRGAYEKIRTRRDRLAYALFDQTPPTAADILAKAAPVGEPRRPKRATLTALLRGEV
ncbi:MULTISPECIES: molecular chaperone DnaJ [unclassified Thiocapsa]|uniref:molecular chaperone DnaJ n=1 Tax=unclassified Thiocapsa TaxID=2641286 RepID=UPI0035ADC359